MVVNDIGANRDVDCHWNAPAVGLKDDRGMRMKDLRISVQEKSDRFSNPLVIVRSFTDGAVQQLAGFPLVASEVTKPWAIRSIRIGASPTLITCPPKAQIMGFWR